MVSVTNPKKQEVPHIIKGDGTSSDIQQWRSLGNSILAKVRNDGLLAVPFLRNTADSGPYFKLESDRLSILNVNAAHLPLIVKGAASQTADLQQWQNSAGTPITKVHANGTITVDTGGAAIGVLTNGSFDLALDRRGLRYINSALEQTTIGAAGTAAALPAAPTKYLRIVDSAGAVLAIPAYASS